MPGRPATGEPYGKASAGFFEGAGAALELALLLDVVGFSLTDAVEVVELRGDEGALVTTRFFAVEELDLLRVELLFGR